MDRRLRHRAFAGIGISLIAGALAFGLVGCAAPGARRAPAGWNFFADPATDLADVLPDRLFRIAEFRRIREWAERRGGPPLRIWLAGGSASGITSYVHEELKTASGDFTRFPYSYFDVYRTTQDADLVIDGGEAEAAELERFLKDQLGHLQGSKRLWEVRLLRESRGAGVAKKDALIGNPDFLDQNSDSYSTGMVELTEPPKGESRIRDLFRWEQAGGGFLADVQAGRITYYRNPRHASTARAAAGYNPEIVSAIRAYTKAFQYDGTFRPESKAELRAVVEAFDPDAPMSADAVRYVTNNAQKIYLHARDLERAQAELSEFGLREKLIRFARKHGNEGLATTLGREPLRTYTLGGLPQIQDAFPGYEPSGLTAEALKITVVAHETNSFLAYENITMSRTETPNVFVSRKGTPGEAAIHGWGLYTRRGHQGARGTHLTVRFEVLPDAIEGRDFFVVGDFVVFRNRAAIRTLPEGKRQLESIEFIRLLDGAKYSQDDLGVLKKLELKFESSLAALDSEGYAAIANELGETLARYERGGDVPASLSYYAKIAGRNEAFRERFFTEIDRLKLPLAKRIAIGRQAPGLTRQLLEKFPEWLEEPEALAEVTHQITAGNDFGLWGDAWRKAYAAASKIDATAARRQAVDLIRANRLNENLVNLFPVLQDLGFTEDVMIVARERERSIPLFKAYLLHSPRLEKRLLVPFPHEACDATTFPRLLAIGDDETVLRILLSTPSPPERPGTEWSEAWQTVYRRFAEKEPLKAKKIALAFFSRNVWHSTRIPALAQEFFALGFREEIVDASARYLDGSRKPSYPYALIESYLSEVPQISEGVVAKAMFGHANQARIFRKLIDQGHGLKAFELLSSLKNEKLADLSEGAREGAGWLERWTEAYSAAARIDAVRAHRTALSLVRRYAADPRIHVVAEALFKLGFGEEVLTSAPGNRRVAIAYAASGKKISEGIARTLDAATIERPDVLAALIRDGHAELAFRSLAASSDLEALSRPGNRDAIDRWLGAYEAAKAKDPDAAREEVLGFVRRNAGKDELSGLAPRLFDLGFGAEVVEAAGAPLGVVQAYLRRNGILTAETFAKMEYAVLNNRGIFEKLMARGYAGAYLKRHETVKLDDFKRIAGSSWLDCWSLAYREAAKTDAVDARRAALALVRANVEEPLLPEFATRLFELGFGDEVPRAVGDPRVAYAYVAALPKVPAEFADVAAGVVARSLDVRDPVLKKLLQDGHAIAVWHKLSERQARIWTREGTAAWFLVAQRAFREAPEEFLEGYRMHIAVNFYDRGELERLVQAAAKTEALPAALAAWASEKRFSEGNRILEALPRISIEHLHFAFDAKNPLREKWLAGIAPGNAPEFLAAKTARLDPRHSHADRGEIAEWIEAYRRASGEAPEFAGRWARKAIHEAVYWRDNGFTQALIGKGLAEAVADEAVKQEQWDVLDLCLQKFDRVPEKYAPAATAPGNPFRAKWQARLAGRAKGRPFLQRCLTTLRRVLGP